MPLDGFAQSGCEHNCRSSVVPGELRYSRTIIIQIHPNPFEKIAFHLPPGSVVALGGPRRRMSNQIGHVVDVVALLEQVGHDHLAKGVGRIEAAILRVLVPVRGRFGFARTEPLVDKM